MIKRWSEGFSKILIILTFLLVNMRGPPTPLTRRQCTCISLPDESWLHCFKTIIILKIGAMCQINLRFGATILHNLGWHWLHILCFTSFLKILILFLWLNSPGKVSTDVLHRSLMFLDHKKQFSWKYVILLVIFLLSNI